MRRRLREITHQHTHEAKSLFRPLPTACCYCSTAKRGGRPYVKDGWFRVWGLSAKRILWEEAHGPVPEGKHLQAMCRRKWCVNPEHMALVSKGQQSHVGKFLEWCLSLGQNPLSYVKSLVLVLTAAVDRQIKSWRKRNANRKQRYGEVPEAPKDAHQEQPPEEVPSVEEMEQKMGRRVWAKAPCAYCGKNVWVDMREVLPEGLDLVERYRFLQHPQRLYDTYLRESGDVSACPEHRSWAERGLTERGLVGAFS